jgi:hypothetical protein
MFPEEANELSAIAIKAPGVAGLFSENPTGMLAHSLPHVVSALITGRE